MIAINNYLALASILFVIGIFGVFLNKKNISIIILIIHTSYIIRPLAMRSQEKIQKHLESI